MMLSSICFSRKYYRKEKKLKCWNRKLCLLLVNAVSYEYGPKNWVKPHLKVFEKIFKFRNKIGNFWTLIIWTLIILKMRGGSCQDLSEPQAFKTVSLQVMIDQTFTFRRTLKKNCTTFKFDVQYEWPKRKRYSFTASSFRFHENLPLPLLPLPTSQVKTLEFLI